MSLLLQPALGGDRDFCYRVDGPVPRAALGPVGRVPRGREWCEDGDWAERSACGPFDPWSLTASGGLVDGRGELV